MRGRAPALVTPGALVERLRIEKTFLLRKLPLKVKKLPLPSTAMNTSTNVPNPFASTVGAWSAMPSRLAETLP